VKLQIDGDAQSEIVWALQCAESIRQAPVSVAGEDIDEDDDDEKEPPPPTPPNEPAPPPVKDPPSEPKPKGPYRVGRLRIGNCTFEIADCRLVR
jgi:hypothetical protein